MNTVIDGSNNSTTPTYSAGKTAVKTAVPFIIVLLANAAIAAIKAAGMSIDDSTVWTIATTGYAAITGFINWVKNRKKS